jgi:hypothetical protein
MRPTKETSFTIMEEHLGHDEPVVPGDFSNSPLQNMLSDEVLLSMLSWVPPSDLLKSICLVNKRLGNLIREDLFWKLLVPDVFLGNAHLTKHQLQRYWLYYTSLTLHEEIPACLQLGSVFLSQAEAVQLRTQSGTRTCAASTTDHTNEGIENVLSLESDGHRRFRDGSTWWSSRPNQSQHSEEVLLFTTRYPVCLLRNVRIKPLRDPMLNVYMWRYTVIRAYLLSETCPAIMVGFPCTFRGVNEAPFHHPRMPASRAAPGQDTINEVLEGQTPVYESDPLPVQPHSSEMIRCPLPPGVVANVVTITLIGKNAEQFQGSGYYYACVEHLDCRGIPLYTHPPA